MHITDVRFQYDNPAKSHRQKPLLNLKDNVIRQIGKCLSGSVKYESSLPTLLWASATA
jgi:hypothetical protein